MQYRIKGHFCSWGEQRRLQERFDTENGGQSIKVCLTIAPAGAAASLRPAGAETADVTQAPAPPQVQPYTHPRLLFFWPRLLEHRRAERAPAGPSSVCQQWDLERTIKGLRRYGLSASHFVMRTSKRQFWVACTSMPAWALALAAGRALLEADWSTRRCDLSWRRDPCACGSVTT